MIKYIDDLIIYCVDGIHKIGKNPAILDQNACGLV